MRLSKLAPALGLALEWTIFAPGKRAMGAYRRAQLWSCARAGAPDGRIEPDISAAGHRRIRGRFISRASRRRRRSF